MFLECPNVDVGFYVRYMGTTAKNNYSTYNLNAQITWKVSERRGRRYNVLLVAVVLW